MSSKSEAVKRWRHNTKKRMVQSMGGKCAICGYNNCNDALELHHINPMEKEFGFGKMTADPKSWSRFVEELRKCVLLCSNHHREIHNGIIVLPDNYIRFDESFVEHKAGSDLMKKCLVCGKETGSMNITCSRECAAKRTRTVLWDKFDLVGMVKSGKSLESIASELNVSRSSVTKRLKKCHPELLPDKDIHLVKRECSVCKTRICKGSKSGLCVNCYGLKRRKVERPTKEQLEEQLKTESWLALGKKYGVSDNSIRKWARSYQIL